MRRVELTAPDGSKVYIFRSWIQCVRAMLPGEGTAGAKTMIIMSGSFQEVEEPVDEVLQRLEFA